MTTTRTTSPQEGTKTGSKLAEGLNQVLADTYALMALTHHAHWNVEGEGFFALHAAFEEQYNDLFQAADEIAERVRALGAYAVGGLGTLAGLAGMEEPAAPVPQKDFVAALIDANEKTAGTIRKVKDLAGKEGDTETEDMLIARLQIHEKTLWMLKSYLK